MSLAMEKSNSDNSRPEAAPGAGMIDPLLVVATQLTVAGIPAWI